MQELRCGAAVVAAVVLLAANGAQAQDVAPTEAERRAAEQRRAAAAATDAALRALEAYGQPAAPPARKDLRIRALDRLERRATPQAARRRPEPAFDPVWAAEGMRTFRAALLARLRQLAPERYTPAPPAPAPGPRVLRTYDVQDLVVAPEDHVTPPTGLGNRAGGGYSSGGVLTFGSDDGAWRTAGVGLDADVLVDLLVSGLDEDDLLADATVEYAAGQLLARARPEVHARLQALLERLRAPRRGLVDLEVRVYALPPALFRRLRSQSDGLDPAGEEALAAATEAGEAHLLSRQRLVAHDGQRVVVRRGRSRSFMGDIEINQTGAIPVANPVVEVLNEGQLLELRPLVDRSTGRVLIDLALTMCRSDDSFETRTVQGLELELPRTGIARCTATSNVALGRGALLGGVLASDGAGELASVVYVRASLIQSQDR